MTGPQPPELSGEVTAVLTGAVAAGTLPGAVFAGGRPGQPAEFVTVGAAQLRGGPRRPMRGDTLFDLASLTKVVATLPAVLVLAERGDLALADPVRRFLPTFSGAGRDDVTVRHLLTHTSGLPAEIKFWQRCTDPAPALTALLAAPLERRPGAAVVYSDVGFMLLGRIVAGVCGAAFDACVADLVTGPLGMTRTCFCPTPDVGRDAAATELQPDGTALTGVVHDENARLFGGVSGHAGLFAPAADLVRYLTGAWLGPELLSPATRAEACRLQTAGTGGHRGLGWVLRGDPMDSLGPHWPATSLSHTGFTGTSLAWDPVSGAWAVLLTNDVHFGRARGTIRPLREAVHTACAPPPPAPGLGSGSSGR